MENKGPLTFPVKLNKNNYLLWARTTKNVLGSRDLASHISLAGKQEGDERSEGKWSQEDMGVLCALHCSLDDAILEAYSHCETSKELWDSLKTAFGNVSNLTRVFEVKKTLANHSQNGGDFTSYFGKHKSLWAELDLLRPTTSDMDLIHKRKEEDKVFGLLLGLDATYTDVIKHILRGDRLPSLDEVCGLLQKEEGSNNLFGGKGSLPSANQGVLQGRREDKKHLMCDHCKKMGHVKDQCWILNPHLKPEKFKKRNPRGNSKANVAYEDSKEESIQDSKAIVQVGSSNSERAMVVTRGSGDNAGSSSSQEQIVVNKSDLEALLQSIASKMHSGISYYSPSSLRSLVVDSGASHHMISNSNLLNNIEPAFGNVSIANGNRVPIEGVGHLDLFGKSTKAFYMPKFTSNLLSVKKLTSDLDCLAIFSPNDVKLQDIETGKVFGQGKTRDELYILEDTSILSLPVSANKATAMNVIWHARLGHPHTRALNLMFPDISFDSANCEACILGKHCKTVFPKSSTIYEHCFDLVHSDVWTSPCISRDRNKYFVTFIDEKSKYTWVTLLPSKDRVFDAFINFQNHVTNQYNAKIKIFRTDNGGEYMGNTFQNHLAKCGIMHQTSCPYTPQQNGVAERKNRHLMEVARSMMFYNNVPKRFWGDAVMMACYLINRTPTRVLHDSSPFQVLNNSTPSVNHLRVFGCVCFVLIPGEARTKLDPKSVKCIFLGYSTTQKGYKCFDPVNNRTYVSRDVKFLEDKSYYGDTDWESLKDLPNSTSDRAKCLKQILEHLSNQNQTPPSPADPASPVTAVTPVTAVNPVTAVTPDTAVPAEPVPEDVAQTGTNGEEVHEESDDDHVTPVLRRSQRIRSHPDTWIHKRVYYHAHSVQHPIHAVCSLDQLPAEHQAYLGKIDMEAIPRSYEEAKEMDVWVAAMDEEAGAMVRNHTWDEVDLPPGKRAVSSKWVFTIKYKSNGDIERYKARLVARGFTQTYGDDYTDTFAPVAKQHTVKVVLSLATNLDWELWQMDVKNAFLQGELEEEVYMTPPPGLKDTVTPGQVLRLRKAIYGLKQSPRAWYHKLSSTLKAHGFRKSEADHTLFTLQNDQGIVVVLVYVDDLIISGSNKAGIQSIKTSLHSVFDIKDLGELKYFLGIEVCRSQEGLFLSQRKYTLDLLKLTGKLGAKPVATPLEAGYKVARKGEQNDKPYHDAEQYRRLVGKLIYLTYTRPDISFAVNQVSQHMQTPTVYHWSMVERILRYLKGSPGQGIWMGKNASTEIVGYCDADWAGDRNDRKSTTGYCTFVGGNLVTWKTKKQAVVACSSAEAEYRAMRKLTDELVWLRALLKDLGVESTSPSIMHCDNQAAIHIANNSVFHERTKHIEIDCHKVRERIEQGAILPCYTRSEDQLADVFTKAASTKICTSIHSRLGLVDLTRP